VTGSGDKTIKIWTNGKCRKTLTPHNDAVRGLSEVSGIGFVSASNDGYKIKKNTKIKEH
jgi:WD40 repeat protein